MYSASDQSDHRPPRLIPLLHLQIRVYLPTQQALLITKDILSGLLGMVKSMRLTLTPLTSIKTPLIPSRVLSSVEASGTQAIFSLFEISGQVCTETLLQLLFRLHDSLRYPEVSLELTLSQAGKPAGLIPRSGLVMTSSFTSSTASIQCQSPQMQSVATLHKWERLGAETFSRQLSICTEGTPSGHLPPPETGPGSTI